MTTMLSECFSELVLAMDSIDTVNRYKLSKIVKSLSLYKRYEDDTVKTAISQVLRLSGYNLLEDLGNEKYKDNYVSTVVALWMKEDPYINKSLVDHGIFVDDISILYRDLKKLPTTEVLDIISQVNYDREANESTIMSDVTQEYYGSKDIFDTDEEKDALKKLLNQTKKN